MKPILTALALCTFLAPAIAQEAATPPAPPQVWVEPHPEVQLIGEATHTTDGLSIAPITVPTSDIALIMDIKMWRFRVQSPKGNLGLNFRMELRRPDQKPMVLASGSFGISSDTELICGLMAKSGDTLVKAETLKLYFRAHDLSPKTNVGDLKGDNGYNVEFKNEIKSLKFDSYSGGEGNWTFISKNGNIVLMEFDNWGGPPRNELVLVLTADIPQPKK